MVHPPYALLERRYGRQESLSAAQGSARQDRQRSFHPRQPHVLHGHFGRFFWAGRGATGFRWPNATGQPALAAGRDRKTVWPRSGIGKDAEPAIVVLRRREADLP